VRHSFKRHTFGNRMALQNQSTERLKDELSPPKGHIPLASEAINVAQNKYRHV